MLGRRQRLRQSITKLLVRLDEDDVDLLFFGPRLAQSFERSIDVLDSAVHGRRDSRPT